MFSLFWIAFIAVFTMRGMMIAPGNELVIVAVIALSIVFCGVVFAKDYFLAQGILLIFTIVSGITIAILVVAGADTIVSTYMFKIGSTGVMIFIGVFYLTFDTLKAQS
jgi:hypothetical protein